MVCDCVGSVSPWSALVVDTTVVVWTLWRGNRDLSQIRVVLVEIRLSSLITDQGVILILGHSWVGGFVAKSEDRRNTFLIGRINVINALSHPLSVSL